MTDAEQALKDALKGSQLWHGRARLLCAVSGGADSTALLLAAARLRGELPFSLTALHVQHGLRGENSLRDEAFVRELCARLAIPLAVRTAELSGTMESPGMETMARDERRRIFVSLAKELSANAVLLAHHRDDQAETVLLHLLRGSGLDGLCAMRECTMTDGVLILRPFLSLSKETLKEYVSEQGLSWREDESNTLGVTPRNILRTEILPRMEVLYPGVSARLARTAAVLAPDADALADSADHLLAETSLAFPGIYAVRKAPLLSAPEAVARRVLRRWYQNAADRLKRPEERSLSAEDTISLYRFLTAKPGDCLNFPCEIKAEAGGEFLYLVASDGGPLFPEKTAEVLGSLSPGRLALPYGMLELSSAGPGDILPSDPAEVILSPEIRSSQPAFRTPLPGDRIHPFGASGGKPLRRWLTDHHVDRPLRASLRVLAVGNTILWIPGLCSSEELRLTDIPDRSLRIRLSSSSFTIFQSSKE